MINLQEVKKEDLRHVGQTNVKKVTVVNRTCRSFIKGLLKMT